MDARGIESDVGAEELLDRLGLEGDEAVVLSVIYDREDGELWLHHAKLLFGPPEIGADNWAEWHYYEQLRPAWDYGPARELSPEWIYENTEFVAGRAVLPVADAYAWVNEALVSGTLLAAGPVPSASAAFAEPTGFVRVFPHLDTRLASLACLTRPLFGFFVPTDPRPERTFPSDWMIDDRNVINAAFTGLGMLVRDETRVTSKPSPDGLLIAKMERRAWLVDARGAGGYKQHELHIGWDPKRCDLADLEVELEESDAEELVYSRRLALGETALPEREGESKAIVSLPTLGRKLRHAARLHDRDGALLDMTSAHWLVEQIDFTLAARGPSGEGEARHSWSVGGEPDLPTLRERLAHLDQAEKDYREALEAGLAGRIVTSSTNAIKLIQQQLQTSRGELLVLDPYFGADATDWQVLDGLSLPTRVLTGSKANPPPSPLAHVDARRMNPRLRKAPPFHDRLYVWDGGGISVGTSPSGLGKRDARIDRFGTVEAEGWRAMFESYWNSPDYIPL